MTSFPGLALVFRASWVQVVCALLRLAAAFAAFPQLVLAFNRGA